ncbi:hypothetical protein [Actinobacillus equuli]|uniref:hypothetical protein n=1 Tax=Actinobacillus equuli TaxID=718 RepID=UPI00244335ED|nr:hypothetical protein [Actinobacillus equuli]WGE61721.1 hypothetical protein NYR74_02975 [Actinobacillus equuli subsp. haemolyticus]
MGSRLGKKCGGNSDYFHRFLLCFLQAVGLAQFFAKYSSEHINDIAVRPALGHQGNKLTVDGLWFNNEPLSKAQHKEWLDSFISARTAKDSENNESKQFWFGIKVIILYHIRQCGSLSLRFLIKKEFLLIFIKKVIKLK